MPTRQFFAKPQPAAASKPWSWQMPDQLHLPLAVAARAWYQNARPIMAPPGAGAGWVPPAVKENIDGVDYLFQWNPRGNGSTYMIVLKWTDQNL